ncbi:hypothetical protein D931_01825 [Enterococcus faecium 13.SD.W.09]|nr:hypothetical protein D931_01825 [Enterococcus faecium 13.SD.W.09]
MLISFQNEQDKARWLDEYCRWFWRIYLCSFLVFVVGSILFRNSLVFEWLPVPIALYAAWNFLAFLHIIIGIKLV